MTRKVWGAGSPRRTRPAQWAGPTVKQLEKLAREVFPGASVEERWDPRDTRICVTHRPFRLVLISSTRHSARMFSETVLKHLSMGMLCKTFEIPKEFLLDGKAQEEIQKALLAFRKRQAVRARRSTVAAAKSRPRATGKSAAG